MTIQFEMIFRGLCLFVPDRDQQTAKVLLVDTRSNGIPKHEPRLRIRTNQLLGEPAWKPDHKYKDEAGVEFGYWNLDDQDLEIVSQAPLGLEVLGPKDPQKNHPGPGEEDWFCWVPNLADAVSTIEEIIPGEATCTIDLDRGTLGSDRLDKNQWKFSDTPKAATRTFARTVKLALEVETAQGVGLRSNKGLIQLEPASKTPGKILVVCENNPAPQDDHHTAGAQRVHHFQYFYNLCRYSARPGSFPVPEVVGNIVEPIGNGSAFCPDGRYEP